MKTTEWTDKAERAYKQREVLNWPSVAPYSNQLGGESYLRRIRRENFIEQARFPQVAEIVEVQIMPTGDGHSTVTLIDGFRGRSPSRMMIPHCRRIPRQVIAAAKSGERFGQLPTTEKGCNYDYTTTTHHPADGGA
jgi:hypothetical protein